MQMAKRKGSAMRIRSHFTPSDMYLLCYVNPIIASARSQIFSRDSCCARSFDQYRTSLFFSRSVESVLKRDDFMLHSRVADLLTSLFSRRKVDVCTTVPFYDT